MNSNKEHWIFVPRLRLQNAGTAAAGYCVCWILQFGLEEFWIHLNVLIERSPHQVFFAVILHKAFH